MNKLVLGILLTMMSCSSIIPNTQGDKRIQILLQLAERDIEKNLMVAEYEAKSALKSSEESNDLYGIAWSNFYLGTIYGTKIFDYKKGLQFYEKAISAAREIKDEHLVTKIYFNSGMLYYELEQYGKCLDYMFACKNISQDIGDHISEAFAQVIIASLYSQSDDENFSKVRPYFDNSLKVASDFKNDSLLTTTLCYYSQALLHHSQLVDAAKYLDKASAALGIGEGTSLVPKYLLYTTRGDIFFQHGMFKDAVQQYETAWKICEHSNMKVRGNDILLKKAWAQLKLNQIEEATNSYNKVLPYFQYWGMNRKLVDVYNGLSQIAYKQGDYAKAFQYKSIELFLKDNLLKDQGNELLSIKSRIQKEQLEIQKKNEQINWLSINLVLLVCLVACFFGLFYLNHQRLRSAKTKSVLLMEKLILEKELQNKELQEEKFRQELEFNAKTLTVNTLNIIQKNEMLLEIKKKFDLLRVSSSDESLSLKIKELVHLVNFGLNLDKDWENFRTHFEQIHTDFFDHLKAKYPDLNSSDLKLCALLKLNLDTKEIAAILNISPQSVKVARSRLRRKLELDIASNLSAFITKVQ